MGSVTNVTPQENPLKSNSKPKLEKLEKTQHVGARLGAGRKKLKVSQNRIWGKVVRDLSKLEKTILK